MLFRNRLGKVTIEKTQRLSKKKAAVGDDTELINLNEIEPTIKRNICSEISSWHVFFWNAELKMIVQK